MEFRDTLSRCPIQRDWCKLQRFGRGSKTEDPARPARPAGASVINRLAKKSVSVSSGDARCGVSIYLVIIVVVGNGSYPSMHTSWRLTMPESLNQRKNDMEHETVV